MMSPFRLSSRAIALALLALLAVGCAFPKGTKPMVKIGMAAPFEGLYRAIGYEALYGVKLAIRERNAEGGLAGYMVELVAVDDGNEREGAILAARKLSVDQGVMGVVGHFSSQATDAALAEYREAELALVVPWSMPRRLCEHPAAFCVAPDEEQLLSALVRYISPSREVAILGQGSEAETFRNLARGEGLNLIAQAPLSDPRWPRLLREAEVIFLDAEVVQGGELLRQARAEGLKATFTGGADLGSIYLVQVAGEAAEGVVYPSPAPAPSDVAAMGDFIARYEELAGFEPGPRALLAYWATNELLDAMARAIACGDLSRQKVREELGKSGRRAITCLYRIEGGRYPGHLLECSKSWDFPP